MRRFVTKIAKNGNAMFVAIPRHLLAEMNLKRGDHVGVTRVGGAIVVMPIERVLAQQIADTTADAPESLREVFAQ